MCSRCAGLMSLCIQPIPPRQRRAGEKSSRAPMPPRTRTSPPFREPLKEQGTNFSGSSQIVNSTVQAGEAAGRDDDERRYRPRTGPGQTKNRTAAATRSACPVIAARSSTDHFCRANEAWRHHPLSETLVGHRRGRGVDIVPVKRVRRAMNRSRTSSADLILSGEVAPDQRLPNSRARGSVRRQPTDDAGGTARAVDDVVDPVDRGRERRQLRDRADGRDMSRSLSADVTC